MPTTATSIIRIGGRTHKKLRELATRTGATMQQLVAAAVEEYERKLFWDQVNDVLVTSKSKGISLHVEISPPEGGMKQRSFVKCEDLRSVSKQRLSGRLGAVKPATLAAVELRVKRLLGLH